MVLPVGNLVLRVVDDAIGTQGPDGGDLGGAAHTRHLGFERLGDLDREAADPSRCSDDQHLLAGLDVALVASLACTRTRTSSSLASGLSTVSSRRTSSGEVPYSPWTIEVMNSTPTVGGFICDLRSRWPMNGTKARATLWSSILTVKRTFGYIAGHGP